MLCLSLHFNEFYVTDYRLCPEKEVLYKANRLLEKYLDDMLEIQKTHNVKSVTDRVFYCCAKLGHICVLAQDWGKALSAYQRAFNTAKDLFWRSPGNYFGLGLVYMHFQEYKLAAQAFSHLLYSFPTGEHAVEAKLRLAVCYHNDDDFFRCVKLYNLALLDAKETPFMNKFAARFNIGLSYENSHEMKKAELEYKTILTDLDAHIKKSQDDQATPDQLKLKAAVNRQLGWIEYRRSSLDEAEKKNHLEAAVTYLKESQKIESADGKNYYFIGRCHGEMDSNAQEAFGNYRQSIDKSEANADTWCSIGALYQKQTQPLDALQAFICAVELDPSHSAAWTDLGELYEEHAQFADALECFKKAVKHNPPAPEPLKARIIVLEKELALPVPPRPAQDTRPAADPKPLPSLKEAWQQPIPSELRGRQDEFFRQKEQKYRDGSPLWRMGDLAAPVGEQEVAKLEPLDELQFQVFELLRKNLALLKPHEREVYEMMGTKYRMAERKITDNLLSLIMSSKLPIFNEADVISLRDTNHLTSDNSYPVKNYEKIEPRVPLNDLPTTFSLLAPLNVPNDITAQEVLAMSEKRISKSPEFRPVFEEEVRPPSPPLPPKPEEEILLDRSKLLRPTPLLLVESRKDAQSLDLQKFCENAPIALVRGLTSVLKMDLSLFSTKTLLENAAVDEMEVRTQYRMPSDVNVDHLGHATWECFSSQKFTTITKYAQYQAETFKHSLKEEAEKLRQTGAKYAQTIAESHGGKRRKLNNGEDTATPMKPIKFGTNVDLSDDVKWKSQLQELSKMPPFCRLIAGSNMLSHLGHQVLGMNTVQLYMKVPGSRTPAHQENNNFASININIGPGDCEWFGCPYEYWGVVEKLCRKHNIDFLKGSYWPNLEELLAENVPVYRFTQKAGDLVWVGGGCVHWVQATGWCNNIAWNVGPLNHTQLTMAIHSYEWNKLENYKSLVPLQHLAWQLAKNVIFTNPSVYTVVRTILIRSLSFCKIVADYAVANGKQLKPQSRTKGEVTHYCTTCEVEVFNILFVKEVNGKFPVYCVYCAKTHGLDEFFVLQQVTMTELTELFDNMTLKGPMKLPLTA